MANSSIKGRLASESLSKVLRSYTSDEYLAEEAEEERYEGILAAYGCEVDDDEVIGDWDDQYEYDDDDLDYWDDDLPWEDDD
jgi:hypothetical protein